MFALLDANNFYVSAERSMAPWLKGKPVVVLSNNDGCVVARSQEVKDLGVKMAQPWFELKDLARQHGIIAFSSNYTLYGDISDRIMTVLRAAAPRIIPYSIDETFIDMAGVADRVALGRQLRAQVAQWVGVPSCVGCGRTLTRAKLGNFIAKKNPQFEGVFDLELLTPTEEAAWLGRIPVGEVWGVGPRLTEQLQGLGVKTVADLQAADPEAIRQRFSVTLARTVLELQGQPCIELDEMGAPKAQIMVSRSFGRPVAALEGLQAAVTAHVTNAAAKLRRQGSVTQAVMVFARTSPFAAQQPQYSASRLVPLAVPSQDTRRLIGAALAGLRDLYRPGYLYQKAGVMLVDLSPAAEAQVDLFTPGDSERSQRLMAALDALNGRMGRGTAFFASEGVRQDWRLRANRKSPAYTTSWQQLAVAHAR